MTKVFCYIDDSGFKSKSRSLTPNSDQKLAVFIGIIVPEGSDTLIRSVFDPGFQKFKNATPAGTKLHLTDVFTSNDQNWKNAAEEVRSSFFQLMRTHNIRLVYGAKRASTHRTHRDFLINLFDKFKKIRSSLIRIQEEHDSSTIEEIALEGLIWKLEAYAEELLIDQIIPLMDQSDNLDRYNAIIDKLTNITSTIVHKVKGWDPLNKKRVEGQIISKSNSFEGLKHIKNIQVLGKEDCLIFLADVIANSLHHHLSENLNPNDKLHSQQSINGWDLESLVYGCRDNWLDDSI